MLYEQRLALFLFIAGRAHTHPALYERYICLYASLDMVLY